MRYLTPLLFIFALGCIPYSDNPLTAPGAEKIDLSILGTWFWTNDKESGYIHIGLDRKSRLLRLLMLELERDGELEVSEFSGHTSSLGGNRYLNLKWLHPAQDDPSGYMFVKYGVNPDSLGIALMDCDVVETAIEKGSLRGKVEKHGESLSVRITEGQEKLRKFILRNDKKLFPEMKYVKKLVLPNERSDQTP